METEDNPGGAGEDHAVTLVGAREQIHRKRCVGLAHSTTTPPNLAYDVDPPPAAADVVVGFSAVFSKTSQRSLKPAHVVVVFRFALSFCWLDRGLEAAGATATKTLDSCTLHRGAVHKNLLASAIRLVVRHIRSNGKMALRADRERPGAAGNCDQGI